MPNGIFTLSQATQAIRQGAWTGFISPKWVEYLVVAGGGTSDAYGGGGAGGLLTGIVTVATGTSYTVTVGAGGAAGAGASNGGNSAFGVVTANGGGFSSTAGSGNGAFHGDIGVQGTGGQGNAGGNAMFAGTYYLGSGGGGAGAPGMPSTSSPGHGGPGISSDISGTRTAYAGGGGGGQAYAGDFTILGGVGGGGAAGGPTNSYVAQPGGVNTGGGGGGKAFAPGSGAGTPSGGSGIVIVRYPGTVQYFTGGALSYANGYVIHTFNASGTLAPTTPTPYVAADYQISRSLRFHPADSTYLSRTPASAGNRKTWTWSAWVKISSFTPFNQLFTANIFTSPSDSLAIRLWNGVFALESFNNNSFGSYHLRGAPNFRDLSAWYHFIVSVDTTQAIDSNRIKMYVNGQQITTFNSAAYPSLNSDTPVNSTSWSTALGAWNDGSSGFNGYMTEVNFIDGQALTPSSFGHYNSNTGVWGPHKYVGAYGTNGFYLNFSDNSNTTAGTLGRDYSGNSNNWTPNNFSVAAGAGNDSLVDTPTPYGTDTGVGGSVRGNYPTLNPLQVSSTFVTLSNGNLQYVDTTAGGSFQAAYSTMFATSGKYYFEARLAAVIAGDMNNANVGLASPPVTYNSYIERTVTGYQGYMYLADGRKATNDTYSAFGSSFTTGDIISVAVDIDAGRVWFAKNGTWQASGNPAAGTNQAFDIVMGRAYGFAVGNGSSNSSIQIDANFGQRPFAYTAPSGFRAMNTQNLSTPTIGATTATQAGKFFNPVLYTGDGVIPRAVAGFGFAPDLIWQQRRDVGYGSRMFDRVRGAGKQLYVPGIDAETNYNLVGSFDADGFTITELDAGSNVNGGQHVVWGWRANGAGVVNTAGSITSTVSANTSSGFSIVTYTGLGGAGNTVGHGLGAVPRMMIVKQRSPQTNYNWFVYHQDIGNTQYLLLNSSNLVSSGVSAWNNTTPTSSVFTLGSYVEVNRSSSTFVAYCFSEVPGYSRFGSYTGNGDAEGPFIYTGFRPAFVMIKCSAGDNTNSHWVVKDKMRPGIFNPQTGNLYTNLTNGEDTTSTVNIDFLANGFKIRGNYSGINFSGGTFVYSAFADTPQKFALAR